MNEFVMRDKDRATAPDHIGRQLRRKSNSNQQPENNSVSRFLNAREEDEEDEEVGRTSNRRLNRQEQTATRRSRRRRRPLMSDNNNHQMRRRRKASTSLIAYSSILAILITTILTFVNLALLSPSPGQAHASSSGLGADLPAAACQYHQALLLEAAARGDPNARRAPPPGPSIDRLLVCPRANQFNGLPHFQAPFTSPALERQQRLLLNTLNASFAAQKWTPMASAALDAQQQQQQPSSLLVDESLLNEIITPLVVNSAFESAKEQLVKRRKLEKELIRQGFITDMSKPTAVARHQRVTTTTSRGNELEKGQEIFEEMSRIIAKNLTLTLAVLRSHLGSGPASSDQLAAATPNMRHERNGAADANGQLDQLETASSEPMKLLSRIDLHASEARHAVSRCEEDQLIICDPSFPFRHADGRCNNLEHPSWGKANTCFARLLAPDYSDGQSAPRISVTGNPLPNPRILSAIVHRDFNYPATYTHFVMQYGQFFAHDIAFTPSSRTKSGQMIQCCPIERDSHPQCFPILVPPDDPFYSNWEESCLNFVRTAVCPRCRLGPREQMNQITSFIDGSQVYGSAANETAALWTKSGPAGRMHVSLDEGGRELLPHSADPSNDQCSDVEKRQFCYRAGDRRVNQHPALTSVHVMWLRQHNRIVNALKMVNPHWNGDRLYQEAKRICGAQMQMVTYNEWLSLIIGQDAMKFLKLNVLPTGYTDYDPTVDPSLLNEFSGAAFRFGHSMINNIFAEILPDGRPSGYRLNEFFFHPFGMKSGQYDMVMRGLISQASQNRDPFVSSDIKNHLYRPRDNPYGLDLPAFNIQRGRDHGIPGYTKLVQFCFDDVITTWKQLDQYMPVSQRIRFSKLYRSVHDLDLFSAGLAEYPLPGAALGPTFTCIVGIQMFNLKYGDRFWFEHGRQVGSFTPDQLQELRKTNLARLMCANSDNINVIQRNVFRGESPSNPSVPCSSLPDTDLKAWMEAPGSKNVFSVAVENEAKEQQETPYGGQENQLDYKRRQNRPQKQTTDDTASYQQELSYAFRSAKKHQGGKNQQQQLTTSANAYILKQLHPVPMGHQNINNNERVVEMNHQMRGHNQNDNNHMFMVNNRAQYNKEPQEPQIQQQQQHLNGPPPRTVENNMPRIVQSPQNQPYHAKPATQTTYQAMTAHVNDQMQPHNEQSNFILNDKQHHKQHHHNQPNQHQQPAAIPIRSLMEQGDQMQMYMP